MKITPEEIDNIEEVGILNKNPVKILRTKGGFHVAIGRPKGKCKEEVLAAGSHPAIVKFNLEKQYPEYHPAMMKSEFLNQNPIVVKHTHFLSPELIKSGHDIYSVQNGLNVEFQITKQNVKIATVQGSIENDSMVLKDLNISKEFSAGIAGATAEKALSCGASKVSIKGK